MIRALTRRLSSVIRNQIGIPQLELSLHTLEASVHTLEASVHNLEASVQTLEASVHNLKASVHTLEGSVHETIEQHKKRTQTLAALSVPLTFSKVTQKEILRFCCQFAPRDVECFNKI